MIDSDELIVISGYVGPHPVERLENIPLESIVIYGMYGSDGIGIKLHQSLVKLNSDISNTTIMYSNIPVHSKCYVWRKNKKIKYVLIGSANFSTNGLGTPFREVLAETTTDTFNALQKYVDKILNNCIKCDSATIRTNKGIVDISENIDFERCSMILYDPKTKEVQNASGLNWGQGIRAHTNKNDSYIPIRVNHIRNYEKFFPAKQLFPSEKHVRGKNHDDTIDIIWDDGTTMECRLEGTCKLNGIVYPKQIASFPHKKVLGEYIRKRIGVELGKKITKADLDRYGRSDVTVSIQGEGIYYFDFSVQNKNNIK